jgi:uncharacterized membrane protein
MKKNLGQTDRTIRAIVGVISLFLAIFVFNGGLAILFYVVAAIALITAILGVCMLYKPFHISTKK